MRRRRFRYNGAMDIEIRAITPERFPDFARVITTAFGETAAEGELADYQRGLEYDRSIEKVHSYG